MKVLINNETKQPYLVVRESDEKYEIASLKDFHFKEKDLSTLPLDYIQEQYKEKELSCFGLLRNSIMTTNEKGEILNNIVSYKVEVRKVEQN